MGELTEFFVGVRCFTYNHAPYIEDTMNGFVMQDTSFPFVCIIVDDASTDGEPRVIKKYLDEHFSSGSSEESRHVETNDYELFFARHKTNRNCYFAVYLLKYNHYSNDELDWRKYKYISDYFDHVKYHALCEGDDYWVDAKKLEKQVDYMECHPDVGMVYSKCKYYYQNRKRFSRSDWGGSSVTFDDLFFHNTVPFASVLYRRLLLESYNRDVKPQLRHWMLGDYPFWLYISKQSKIFFFNNTFTVYRVLPESASHSSSFEKSDAFIRSLFDMKDFFCEYFNTGYDLHDYKYKSLSANAIACKRRDECCEYLKKIKVKGFRIKVIEYLSNNPFTFKIIVLLFKTQLAS